MLPGVVPFPPEFARRYREKGYWQGKSLAEEFAVCFSNFGNKVFLVDGERQYTFADVDRISDNLALNLLELGLKPLDRVVPTLPNCAEFVILYFALPSIRTQEDLVGRITPEMLGRNLPRFAILTQQAIAYGFHSQEHFLERLARAAPHAARFPEGANRP